MKIKPAITIYQPTNSGAKSGWITYGQHVNTRWIKYPWGLIAFDHYIDWPTACKLERAIHNATKG